MDESLAAGMAAGGPDGTRTFGPRQYPDAPAPAAVLVALDDLTRRDGWPPTIRELAAALDVSTAHVVLSLVKLDAFGYVERQAGSARAVRVTAAGRALLDAKAADDAAA